MPGPIYHLGNVVMCPHGGQVQDIPTSPNVLVSGQPVGLATDQYMIAGCAFTLPIGPHPCIRVQWLVPSLRVKVFGVPVMLMDSVGLCQAPDMIPQGAPIVSVNQPRVIAT
jgi:hypothetical protein